MTYLILFIFITLSVAVLVFAVAYLINRNKLWKIVEVKHNDKFNEILQKYFAKRGIPYKPQKINRLWFASSIGPLIGWEKKVFTEISKLDSEVDRLRKNYLRFYKLFILTLIIYFIAIFLVSYLAKH